MIPSGVRTLRLSLLAALYLAAVACSSSPKPPPEEPVKPEEPKVVESPPDAKPPELAESELCPKLVERVTASMSDGDLRAKMTPVIEKHCPTWPEPVRRCLATVPDAEQEKCIEDLDPALRDAFVGDLIAATAEPPSCVELGATAAAWYTPPQSLPPPDLEAAYHAVGALIVASCQEAGWSETARTCVRAAAQAPRACLDDTAGAAFDVALKRRADLFARAAAVKPSDKRLGCAKVAAVAFDATWAAKMTSLSKKERKRLAKDAAAVLAKACTAQAWSPFVRACIVTAGTEEERGWCSPAPGDEPSMPDDD